MKPLERLTHRTSFRSGIMSVSLMAMMLVTGVACDQARMNLSHLGASRAKSRRPRRRRERPCLRSRPLIHLLCRAAPGRRHSARPLQHDDRGGCSRGNSRRSSRVDVVIETASLDSQNDSRDAELRGPDFFDVTAFPEDRVSRHRLGRRLRERWIVDGSLTIRGVAREVPLELVFNGTAPSQAGQPSRIAVHATAAVKRADFGMTRGLLDEIGMISARPDVWIEIDAEFLAEARGSHSGQPAHQSMLIERK